MPIDVDQVAAHAAQAWPGVVGSFIGMWRAQGATWSQRGLAFVSGCALSYWATAPVLGTFPALNHELTALLLGWFGKAVVDKVFQVIDELELLAILRSYITRTPPSNPPK